jgi:hypothetical protein
MAMAPSDDDRRRAEAVYKMAERYHKLGLSVLPIQPGAKSPAKDFLWGAFMKERADASQRFTWFMDPPFYQVGIISGPISRNLVHIDMDGADPAIVRAVYDRWAADHPVLDTLPMVDTGSDRIHLYFLSPRPVGKYTITKDGVRIEIRGQGHYVVAPPSLHPSGNTYRWRRPPWDGIPIVDPSVLGLPDRPPPAEDTADTPAFTPGDPLTDSERDEIVTLLSPHWHPGARHDVALATAGWLAGKDVPEPDAWGVVAALANPDDDRRALRRAVRGRRKAAGGMARSAGRASGRPAHTPATAKDSTCCCASGIRPGVSDHHCHAGLPWIVSAGRLLAEADEGDAWLCDELVRPDDGSPTASHLW